jgi:hypothetical protein
MDCAWVIDTDFNYYIKLTVTSFKLDDQSMGQCNDYLTVRQDKNKKE